MARRAPGEQGRCSGPKTHGVRRLTAWGAPFGSLCKIRAGRRDSNQTLSCAPATFTSTHQEIATGDRSLDPSTTTSDLRFGMAEQRLFERVDLRGEGEGAKIQQLLEQALAARLQVRAEARADSSEQRASEGDSRAPLQPPTPGTAGAGERAAHRGGPRGPAGRQRKSSPRQRVPARRTQAAPAAAQQPSPHHPHCRPTL